VDAVRRAFLESLLSAPSPSGYEQPIQLVWRDYAATFADAVSTDAHGNAIAVRNPAGAPRLMFAGHCDELGFQVLYINDQGFVYFGTIGGHDANLIPGRRVIVHGGRGPVRGVTGKKAVHLMEADERDKAVKVKDVWIDIGVRSRREAERLIRVGDPVTYDTAMQDLRRGIAVSRAFDNKIGAWIVAEGLRRIRPRRLKAAVHAVSTVQEEIGLRGAHTSAYGIDPAVAVAVDVTHATDHPNVSKTTAGDIRLGKGAVITRGPNINPVVERLLFEVAVERKIPHQVEAEPRGTGTDANAIQLARAGVATGLVSVPLRYMHTPSEVIALEDAEAAADLLAAFAETLTPSTDFTP